MSDTLQLLTLITSIICISLMSCFLGIKIAHNTRPTSYARILVLVLNTTSWGFSVCAAVANSINDYNMVACTLSVFLCIIMYAFSKIVIYLFFIERVHVVTSMTASRMENHLYRINLFLLTPFAVILVLMCVYRVAYIDSSAQSSTCNIGLHLPASLSLIIYDFVISCYLTALFIRQLVRVVPESLALSTSLKYVAYRNVIATLISLVVSVTNLSILLWMRGDQRGLICLTSCTLDVTINAATINWVTSYRADSPIHTPEIAIDSWKNTQLQFQADTERSITPLQLQAEIDNNFTLELQVDTAHSFTSLQLQAETEQKFSMGPAMESVTSNW